MPLKNQSNFEIMLKKTGTLYVRLSVVAVNKENMLSIVAITSFNII